MNLLQLGPENKTWKNYKPLLWMLIFPVLGWLYTFMNHANNREIYTVATTLDSSIPFVKYFAIPYAIWIVYIYICLIYFFKQDTKVYYRNLITYVICVMICYLIYSLFQTTVQRPFIAEADPLLDPFSWIINFIYLRDMPYNCFPSIHCFSSYMVMRTIWTSSFRNKWNISIITFISSSIILSTLFVKQHVILDALAAICLVEVVTAAIIFVPHEILRTRWRNQSHKNTYGA